MKGTSKPRTIYSLHPRVGASFALVPITIGVEVFLFLSASYASTPNTLFDFGPLGFAMLMGITPVVIFYGGSLLIWCPVVQWNRKKVIRTMYVSVGLALVTGAGGYFGGLKDPTLAIIGMLTTSCIGGGIAIILLNVFWWTPPHLRVSTECIPCPNCGYDLHAQRECRCPECGSEFTVSQLLASCSKLADM